MNDGITENHDYVLLGEVQLRNQEGISLDVIFQFHTYKNDNCINVGGINVKVYDEKWCNMLYAADADGAHEHIFATVVIQTEKYIPIYDVDHMDDNYVDDRFKVWGRVAVIDCNFHAFQLDKSYWNQKTAISLFKDVEDYLIDVLNVDFIVLDLNTSVEGITETPSLLLLAKTEKLPNCSTEAELEEVLEEVQEWLSGWSYLWTGAVTGEIYMIKSPHF